MYSKGSEEIKEWIIAAESICRKCNEEGEGNQDLGMVSTPNAVPAKDKEEFEEDLPSSPFDILERVRDICNKNLKDPEDDEEIEKILKEIADEVHDYVSVKGEDEDEKVSGEQQPSQSDPDAQAPTSMSGDMGRNQDMGAPGASLATAAGIGMSVTPASGGQM